MSERARQTFLDPNNRLFLSVASVWEIAIKSSTGKLQLGQPLSAFLDAHLSANGIELLDIRRDHAERVESLPFHHRDPFDRILVAQAVRESIPLLSADATFDAYEGVTRIW